MATWLMLGLGTALKLTPAVFLLYCCRDGRAALTALALFAVAMSVSVLAWRDSWEY